MRRPNTKALPMAQALPVAAIDPLVQRYLDHVQFEKRLASRTLILYRRDLQRLQRMASEQGLGLMQVQSADVRRWMAQLHARGHRGRGLALVLSVWRGFYAWAGREALLAHNPLTDVRAPKAAKPLPKALSVDDAVNLAGFEAQDADPWLQSRDVAMIGLLYGSGLRLSELTGLDVQASVHARGWVDLQGAEAHVLGKGNKRRVVPVGQPAILALKRWLTQRSQRPLEGQAALFVGVRGTRLSAQSVWRCLRARSLQAGLPVPVHPHMLRHSFASHVLQSSSDLRGVQELLGHANIGTTQIYTRLDFGHLSKVYDAAHPRARKREDSQ